ARPYPSDQRSSCHLRAGRHTRLPGMPFTAKVLPADNQPVKGFPARLVGRECSRYTIEIRRSVVLGVLELTVSCVEIAALICSPGLQRGCPQRSTFTN